MFHFCSVILSTNRFFIIIASTVLILTFICLANIEDFLMNCFFAGALTLRLYCAYYQVLKKGLKRSVFLFQVNHQKKPVMRNGPKGNRHTSTRGNRRDAAAYTEPVFQTMCTATITLYSYVKRTQHRYANRPLMFDTLNKISNRIQIILQQAMLASMKLLKYVY